MADETSINKLDELIINDKKFLFSSISYASVLAIFLNLTVLASVIRQQATIVVPLVGALASLSYFLINGTFLGHFFFKEESFFLRLLLGNLLLIVFLGFVAWVVIIVSNLDITRSVAVLFIVAIFASFLNRVKSKHWKWIENIREPLANRMFEYEREECH